jgi:hypothetical protein
METFKAAEKRKQIKGLGRQPANVAFSHARGE